MKMEIHEGSYLLRSHPALYRETLVEFADLGYAAASVNEIIRRSGFNKGSFYYRFKDKVALYAALLGSLYQQHLEVLNGPIPRPLEAAGVSEAFVRFFASMRSLGELDPRLLRLYSWAGTEPDEVKSGLNAILEPSPIDTFVSHCTKVLQNAGGPVAAKALVVAALLRSTLRDYANVGFHAGVLRDSTEIATALSAITGIASSLPPEEASSNAHIPEENDRQSLVVPKGLTTVVCRDGSNLDPILAQIHAELAHLGQETCPAQYYRRRDFRFGATPSSFLGHWASGSKKATLLADFGLESVATIPLAALSSVDRMAVSMAAQATHRAGAMFVRHANSMVPEPETARFCRMVLKCREYGNTMILTTSDLGLALSVADRVLFVAAGRIVNTVEGDELRSRYGAAFVVVSYRDDHGPAFATFDIRDLSGAAFRSLTSTKPILSIQTGNLPDDLIFKAETGESMQ